MFVVKIEGIISNRICVFNPHANIKCFLMESLQKLCSGMSFGIFILQTLDGYMRIYLRRCKGAVPQHLLNASQVRPGVKQMRREGMSQLMRRYIGWEVSGRKPFFHSALRFPRR